MSISSRGSISRRGLMAAGATGAVASLVGLRPARAETKWQFAMAYQESTYHTQNNRWFAEQLEKATNGALALQVHTNGSLLPMPQMKRGVQTQQVQMGEIMLSVYGNEDPFFEVDAIPQLVSSWEEAKKLMVLSKPYLDARFAKQGVMSLWQVPWPPAGFYSNAPLVDIEGLRGTKMRTFNAVTNRFATLVGATPTLVQAAEVPQAFATGVVNSMVTSATTGVDTQAWDYAKIYTPVGFSQTRNAILVNRRAFEALPQAQQKIVLDLAAQAETRGWDLAKKAQVDNTEILRSKGVTIATATPELLAGLRKVSTQMTDEWVVRAGDDGKKLIAAYRA